MSYRTATKEDFLKSGFAYKRKSATQEVTKIVTSTDFQIGLAGANKSLVVTGNSTLQGSSLFEGTISLNNIGYIGNNEISLTDATSIVLGSTDTTSTIINGQSITINAGSGETKLTSGSFSTNRIISIGVGGDGLNNSGTQNIFIGKYNATGIIYSYLRGDVVSIGDDGGTVTIGNSTSTATLPGTIATSATTFNLVNDATTINMGSTAVTRSINIGTGASPNAITVGSTNTTSQTTLQAGTGGVTVSTGTAGTGTIQVGNSTGTYTINIGLQGNNTGTQTINVGHYGSGGFKNVNINGDAVNVCSNTNSDLGFFNKAAATGPRSNTAGNVSAPATYDATARAMLDDAYKTLQRYGLLTGTGT